MDAVTVLRKSADFAFQELLEAISDIDEPRSWAVVTPVEGEYLHTAGCIVAIVQHIAACKYGYANCAFPRPGYRGRDIFARQKEIGADWEKSKAFLQESQDFWLESWAPLTSGQLDGDLRTIWNKPWPAWKIITRMSDHDQYHTGQITLIRTILPPTTTPPDMNWDEEEKYAKETPYW